jgi:hypothetical protein
MLDVHPAHHAATTWRDFLIHIATIVIGLVIAVGLEQTVEYFHHRHEIAHTREALRLEREENYKLMEKFVRAYKVESAILENNKLVLAALQQHPGTPAEKLPGVLVWRMTRNQFLTSAWHTAQSEGVLALMPKDEVLSDEKVYDALRDITNENEEEWLALNDTWSFQFIDPDPSHLTAAQIADLTTTLQKQMMKHYLRGNFMGYPHRLDPSFDPGPPNAELLKFHQTNFDIQSEAVSKTTARLKTAGWMPQP